MDINELTLISIKNYLEDIPIRISEKDIVKLTEADIFRLTNL